MIRYLCGKVIEKIRNQAIIDVQGVGYGVVLTPVTLTALQPAQAVSLYISESIREDAHDLYGFLASSERDVFEHLRKVSGVGPKVAMAIIGFYSPSDITTLVQNSEVAKLSLVPGVGSKMAGKIIVELQGRLDASSYVASDVEDDDTVAALQSLGYSRVEITKILPKIPKSLQQSTEKVTWILQHLAE